MSDSGVSVPSLADDRIDAAAARSSPSASSSTSNTSVDNASSDATPASPKATPFTIDTITANALPRSSKSSAPASASASVSTPRPRPKPGQSTANMNGPLYMQTSGSNTILVRRLKRKEESTWKHISRWFIENQIGLSFNLLALLFLAHNFIPRARVHTAKFFQLSYYNEDSGNYRIGFDDVYFIAACIVLFTGLRAATMEYVLAPIARSQGITQRKTLSRFSEQAWLLVYYGVFWPIGVHIYYNSPYWFVNLKELWTNWPNRELDPLMKAYMLGQWAFWLQQMLVIHLEDRRKDHWQMFSHHVVTSGLIWACYCYHHTRIGNFILVIMDVVDLFLPLAKCLRYSGYTKACDAVFVMFVVSWFLARHVMYLMACWSIYAHSLVVIGSGCFKGANDNLVRIETPPGYSYMMDPFVDTTGVVCHNDVIKWAFLTPLLFLQGLTIAWFTMIVRVIINVLQGGSPEDTRSDDEGGEEEEEEEEFVYEEAQPLEEEVGVEELDLRNWERRTGVKKQASSSGVSLPGHSDRKELLGRIGCEKQVD